MTSPVKMHDFCHACMSPSPHHHLHHNHHNHNHNHNHNNNNNNNTNNNNNNNNNNMLPEPFSRCLDLHGNMDYARSGGCGLPDAYAHSPYPVNGQSMTSCMYSSPQHMAQGLRASDQYMSPSKENGLFRDSPQCRRRLDFNHNDFIELSKAVPVAVAKRNERERNRVKLINTTFHTLRQHLPVQNRGAKGQAKKLSKVQTLRSAIDYIRKLEDLVEERKGKQGGTRGGKGRNDKLSFNSDGSSEGDAEIKFELVDSANEMDSDRDDARNFPITENDCSSPTGRASNDSQLGKSEPECSDETQSSGSENTQHSQTNHLHNHHQNHRHHPLAGFMYKQRGASDMSGMADQIFVMDDGAKGQNGGGSDGGFGGVDGNVSFDQAEHEDSAIGDDDEFFDIDLWF